MRALRDTYQIDYRKSLDKDLTVKVVYPDNLKFFLIQIYWFPGRGSCWKNDASPSVQQPRGGPRSPCE